MRLICVGGHLSSQGLPPFVYLDHAVKPVMLPNIIVVAGNRSAISPHDPDLVSSDHWR